MRTLTRLAPLAPLLFALGCLGGSTYPPADPAPPAPTPDMAMHPTGGSAVDMATQQPGGGAVDMAMQQTGGGGDMARGTTGTQAFGTACTTASQCQSGYCENVMMTMICTQPCNGPGDPPCPAGASCNNRGFCK